MIPKIIHAVWIGNKNPFKVRLYRKCFESWLKFNEGFKIMLWFEDWVLAKKVLEDKFIKKMIKKYPKSLILVKFIPSRILKSKLFNYYKKIGLAFASDYVRCKIVYEIGGIYQDFDSENIKSLDVFLNKDVVLGYEGTENLFVMGGFFISKEKSDFLSKVLKEYNNLMTINDCRSIPWIFDKVYRYYFKGEINPYPTEYFIANSYKTGIKKITENTYCIHHYNGSWLSKKAKIAFFLVHIINKLFGYNKFTKKIIAFLLRNYA